MEIKQSVFRIVMLLLENPEICNENKRITE